MQFTLTAFYLSVDDKPSSWQIFSPVMHCMLIDWRGLKLCSKESVFITGTPFWLIFIMIFYDDAAGEKRIVAATGCIGSARLVTRFYLVTLYWHSVCTVYIIKNEWELMRNKMRQIRVRTSDGTHIRLVTTHMPQRTVPLSAHTSGCGHLDSEWKREAHSFYNTQWPKYSNGKK